MALPPDHVTFVTVMEGLGRSIQPLRTRDDFLASLTQEGQIGEKRRVAWRWLPAEALHFPRRCPLHGAISRAFECHASRQNSDVRQTMVQDWR